VNQVILSLQRVARLLCISTLFVSSLVEAQYNAPGSGLGERQIITKESLDQQLEASRWTLGGLRVTPYAGISEVTYQSNVFGTGTGSGGSGGSGNSDSGGVNDVTATFHAGLDLMLPLGTNSYFTAQFLPGYNWWKDLGDQRQIVGNYEANLYGLFNRMRLELSGSRSDQVERFSSEVLQRAPQTRDRVGLDLNIDLARRVQITASGSLLRTGLEEPNRPTELGLLGTPLLNRDEKTARLGLRFHAGDRWSFGLGLQEESTDFDSIDLDRSNDGSSLFATIKVQGNRLDFGLDVVERSLRARDQAAFANFDSQTGFFRMALHPGWRFDYFLYGSRSLTYSLLDNNSFFEEERAGLGIGGALSSRTRLQLFVESGQNLFTPLEGEIGSDDEDFTSYGGNLNYSITDNVSLRIGGERLRFESQITGISRSETRINSGLSISFGRSLGTSGSGQS
jgi:hypothetical protein